MQKFIGQFSQEDIRPVSEELQEAAEYRRKHGPGPIQWSPEVFDYDTGIRCDPIITGLRERREEFTLLFATFHDEVFLGAKQDSGTMYVTADQITDDSIRLLKNNWSIAQHERTKSLGRKRYAELRHDKVLTDDIVRPMQVMKLFDMTPEQKYNFVTAPAGAIALHTLYAPWEIIVANVERDDELTETQKTAYVEHLQDKQMHGIANLIAMLNTDGLEPDNEQLLRLMNAAYSLDNPADPFSQHAFEDPVVQYETDFDWRILRRAINLFGTHEKFQVALTQGSDKFGVPTEPAPIVLNEKYQRLADSFNDPEMTNNLAFLQILRERQPEFVNALEPPEDLSHLDVPAAFNKGVVAAMEAIKLGTVHIDDKRPIIDISEVSAKQLQNAYAPSIHQMEQDWLRPLVTDPKSFNYQQGNTLPPIPEQLQELPDSLVDKYTNWAIRLIRRFPANYDVPVEIVAQQLHTKVCLPLYNSLRSGSGMAVFVQWSELCETAYENLSNSQKQHDQEIAHHLLIELPALILK